MVVSGNVESKIPFGGSLVKFQATCLVVKGVAPGRRAMRWGGRTSGACSIIDYYANDRNTYAMSQNDDVM